MTELCLKILNKNMVTTAVNRGDGEVNLVYSRAYEEGDQIILETGQESSYVWIQLDDALGSSLVYLTGSISYEIPFGEKRINLSPKAFSGEKHLLFVRAAQEYEVQAYRNLAVNVNDQHHIKNMFPHAIANVETRGESIFAAQNAINGNRVNSCHGEWPYESWGINMQKDAVIRLEFGRTVLVDKIILYTRADFPHDNWWKQVTFSFSDGSEEIFNMEKSSKPHTLSFEKKEITWVEMNHMISSDEPSPFPALSQIEVYGTNQK